MILEPWKSAEEIDKRLAALNDPELAELLRRENPSLLRTRAEEPELEPPTRVRKKHLTFMALAGLLAMAAGYASAFIGLHQAQTKALPIAIPVQTQRHVVRAVHVRTVRRAPVPIRHAAAAVAVPVAPVQHIDTSSALIAQARAQIAHERALAQQAERHAALAQHNAQVAMQAQERAQAQFLAQAQARAQTQARAEAAQAEAQARLNSEAYARQQEQTVQNEQDPSIKPGDTPPTGGTGSTYPTGAQPVPMPGPVDTNCTPSHGSIFRSMLSHVRVGGTNVGNLLRMVP